MNVRPKYKSTAETANIKPRTMGVVNSSVFASLRHHVVAANGPAIVIHAPPTVMPGLDPGIHDFSLT